MEIEHETHYARSGDIHIAYQVFGDGPFNVVVIPGAWSHVELGWETSGAMLERFAKFARVAIFDKRGTGLSDRNVGIAPLEVRMDDTRAVMDACGMESASILGMSEGGPMALLFAATFPERVRSLVMYGSSPTWRFVPEVPGSAKAARYATELARVIESGWGTAEGWHFWVGSDFDVPELRPNIARAWRTMVSPRDARQIMEMTRQIDVRKTLPLVTCPTIVIASSEDEIGPPETGRWMADQIPDARYAEIEGPHYPVWPGQAEKLTTLIEEFLTGAAVAMPVTRALSTVLFTDIVSSTDTAARLGDQRWREMLEAHDRLAARLVTNHGGNLVKSTGDGILATFDGPGRAVRCALELATASASAGIDIRAGIHTGEVELRSDGDVSGIAVHLASRVESEAGAGEVLVSRTVTDLTFGADLTFESRGEHELKGIPGTWELFAAQP